MIRNLKLRSKLALLVFVPVVAVLALAVPTTLDHLGQVRDADHVTRLSGPVDSLGLLTVSLSDEEGRSVWYVASGGTASKRELTLVRHSTDNALSSVRSSTADLKASGASASTLSRASVLLAELGRLSVIRGQIDARTASIGTINSYFQNESGRAVDLVDASSHDVKSGKLSSLLHDDTTLLRAGVAAGEERSLILAGILTGALPADLYSNVVSSVATQASLVRSFDSETTSGLRSAVDRTLGPNATGALATTRVAVLAGQEFATAAPNWDVQVAAGAFASAGRQGQAQRWYDASTVHVRQLFQGAGDVVQQLRVEATSLRDSARRSAEYVVGGAAIALLLALLVASFVARSITRPLRRLTRAARNVSGTQLPRMLEALDEGGTGEDVEIEPIRIETHDEIGELARAFNSIGAATSQVAREQAALLRQGISDLYINLARRNQSLLDRQIGLIDDLETIEKDPETLDSLFQLDHLATRMRRNAESLLVLAGAEQARPRGGTVDLIDVVRAAASEIGEFTRITMTGIDEHLSVPGAIALDVTHLFAELLENAATFSPPDSQVTIRGRRDDESYCIEIVDEGIGMSDERIAEANDRLAKPSAARLALSRALGFVVVAHLAARSGLRVVLAPTPGGGLTASVALPPSVLVDSLGRTASASQLVEQALPPSPPASPAPVPSAPVPPPETVPPLPSRPAPPGPTAPPSDDVPPRPAPPSAPDIAAVIAAASARAPEAPSRPGQAPAAGPSDGPTAPAEALPTVTPGEGLAEGPVAPPVAPPVASPVGPSVDRPIFDITDVRPSSFAELTRDGAPTASAPRPAPVEEEPEAQTVMPDDDLLPRRRGSRSAMRRSRPARTGRRRARHPDTDAEAAADPAPTIEPPAPADTAPERPSAADAIDQSWAEPAPVESFGAGVTSAGLVQRVPGGQLSHRPVAHDELPPVELPQTSPEQARSLLSDFMVGMRRGGRDDTAGRAHPDADPERTPEPQGVRVSEPRGGDER